MGDLGSMHDRSKSRNSTKSSIKSKNRSRSSIVISMAFTCLAHKRNARAKICIQIYLCAWIAEIESSFGGSRSAEGFGTWTGVLNSNLNLNKLLKVRQNPLRSQVDCHCNGIKPIIYTL